MFVVTSVLAFPLAPLLTLIYISLVLFITFLCPYWLIHVQKFKRYAYMASEHQPLPGTQLTDDAPIYIALLLCNSEIRGPWDEAVPSAGKYYIEQR